MCEQHIERPQLLRLKLSLMLHKQFKNCNLSDNEQSQVKIIMIIMKHFIFNLNLNLITYLLFKTFKPLNYFNNLLNNKFSYKYNQFIYLYNKTYLLALVKLQKHFITLNLIKLILLILKNKSLFIFIKQMMNFEGFPT